MGGRRYLVAVCSAIVLGAVLFWIGGVLIGLAMLELEENRKMFLLRGPGPEATTTPSLDWRLVCAGLAVFASGLCLMVLTQISIFRRTYVERRKIVMRLRFVERRGGIRKKRVIYAGNSRSVS